MFRKRKAAVGYAASVAAVRALTRTDLLRHAQDAVDRTLRAPEVRRRKRRRMAVIGGAAALATAAAVTSAGVAVRHHFAA
jgi:hypothetical protein